MEEPIITVRHVATVGWQVLLDGDEWHTCRKEQDARYIAHHVLIARAVLSGVRMGTEVARELDEAVVMVGHQIGDCAALRLMNEAAVKARE
ncbi:hypothetical protein [Lacipirellula parvula]|uniref:Uncharacterized protein n=1 Tax=Lacipirellula parvula TaxID=2650471 RepID=A0A5K7XBQ6_9BACT|nr:hypothetical protein [Lacipirellula parvula]BBO33382.1 hypothetical protein PLANPX_2994 [Lacipirellula parvula]